MRSLEKMTFKLGKDPPSTKQSKNTLGKRISE